MRLDHAGLVVGGHHRHQGAALAFAQGDAQAFQVDHAIAPSPAAATPAAQGKRSARRSAVASTEECSIAETNRRVMRRFAFRQRTFHRAGQGQVVGFGGAAGEDHLRRPWRRPVRRSSPRASSTMARAARPCGMDGRGIAAHAPRHGSSPTAIPGAAASGIVIEIMHGNATRRRRLRSRCHVTACHCPRRYRAWRGPAPGAPPHRPATPTTGRHGSAGPALPTDHG